MLAKVSNMPLLLCFSFIISILFVHKTQAGIANGIHAKHSVAANKDPQYSAHKLHRVNLLSKIIDLYAIEAEDAPPKKVRRGKRVKNDEWAEMQKKHPQWNQVKQELKQELEEPKEQKPEAAPTKEEKKEDEMITNMLQEYEDTHKDKEARPPLKVSHSFFKKPEISKELGVSTMDVKPENEEAMVTLSGPLAQWLVNEYMLIKDRAWFKGMQKGLKIASYPVKKGAEVVQMPVVIVQRQFIAHALSIVTSLITDFIGGSILLFKEKFTSSLKGLFTAIATKTQDIGGRLKALVPKYLLNGAQWFVTQIKDAVERTMNLVFRGFTNMFKMVMVYGVRKFQEIIGVRFKMQDKIEPYSFTDEAYEKIKETHETATGANKRSIGQKMKHAMSAPIRNRAFKFAISATNDAMKRLEFCVRNYLDEQYLTQVQDMVNKAPKFKEWLREKIKKIFHGFINLAFKIVKEVFNHAKKAIATAKGISYDESMNLARIEYMDKLKEIFNDDV